MWNTKCKSHKSAPDTSCQAIDHGYHILDFRATLPGHKNNVCCVETCFKNPFLWGSINIDFDNVTSWRKEKSITMDHVADFLPTDQVHEKKCLFCLCFVCTACSTDRDWTTCQHTWYPPTRFSTIPFHLHLSGRSRDLFFRTCSRPPRHSGEVLFPSRAWKSHIHRFFLHNGKKVMIAGEVLKEP